MKQTTRILLQMAKMLFAVIWLEVYVVDVARPKFIGRETELKDLNRFLRKKTASMIVVRGRRRIGKSRLIEEFSKDMELYSFTGLAPNKQTTAQMQRDIFAKQLQVRTGLPVLKTDDWIDLFTLLHERVKTGRIILFFDEISWMGSEDPNFLSKIKDAWDLLFKKNSELIFIICGSASSWIEENILSNTGFLGRISYTMTLEELPLQDCVKFWGAQENNTSAFEKFKLLSITGGVPKYLEEIDPNISAEENIRLLCFKKGGILVDEFDRIFATTFKRISPLYKLLVHILVYGAKETTTISNELKTPISGVLTDYLQELVLAGFVKREYVWDFKTGNDAKFSKYRLTDNYLRFYLRYIEKSINKIDKGMFNYKSVADLPEWRTIMGLQFENLVLNNRLCIFSALNLSLHEIVNDNAFFQHTTTKQRGCQIDYLIQTRHNTLYICEIKFSKNPIGIEIIDELKQKIKRLVRPKGMSCRPVLIHVNGVRDEVCEAGYFSNIIDMSEFLQHPL